MDGSGEKIESRLREAESKYRNLVEQLPLVTYTDATDEHSSAIYMSPQIEPLLGYSVQEWLDDPELFCKLLHPDDRDRVMAEVARSSETGEPFRCEYRLMARDRRVVWFHDEATHVLDENGRPLHAQGYLLDITKRKTAERELERLVAVIQSSDDAIASATPDGTIESWNPGAERMSGYSASEIVGRPVSVLFPAERSNELPRLLERIRRGEAIRHLETTGLTKDGQRIEVSLSISPIKDSQGNVIAISSVARDMGEAKRAREEADRLKDEFIALISHELRTPLTSIKGYLDLLLDGEAGKQNDPTRRFLEVLARNSAKLERLVGDLLLVAGPESGEFTFGTEPLDLYRLVRDCVGNARPQASQKGIELVLRAECVARCTGDGERLEQLLDHLLSNAIKYTPEDKRVELRLRRDDDRALIEVEDSGVGIAPSDQERVFERFFRASAATEMQTEGMGIGLTIARAIAEAHGGRIEVESKEGAGSTFRVELPIHGSRGRQHTTRYDAGAA